jgi:(p)ppGpp synthase/HD superfamily hydrolase
MKKLALAISITAKAFEDKLDKGGQPYILHCLYVMHNTEGDEDVKCAAVMHDLVEDTDYTLEKLLIIGFSYKTVELLRFLTHVKGVSYEDYIQPIIASQEATRIKLTDLEHNSNITRLKGVTTKDLERIEKYHRAYLYLKNK